MLKTKAIQFSIPGWISVSMEPNEAEQRAAWILYVELSTRIAVQPFNAETGRLRRALDSLYLLFEITRGVLRDGGPALASGPASFGPVAIRFLTEVLAPFTTKWHEPLLSYELSRPKEQDELGHEREWDRFDEITNDLRLIQVNIQGYVRALGQVAGVDG
jgi:hypothetical protein